MDQWALLDLGVREEIVQNACLRLISGLGFEVSTFRFMRPNLFYFFLAICTTFPEVWAQRGRSGGAGEGSTKCTEQQLQWPKCSDAIANKNCSIHVSGNLLAARPVVRLEPKAQVCIVVAKKPAEAIEFAPEFKDVLPQDPFVTAAEILNPILKAFVGRSAVRALRSPTRQEAEIRALTIQRDRFETIEERLKQLSAYQEAVLQRLLAGKSELKLTEQAIAELNRTENKTGYQTQYEKICPPSKKCDVTTLLVSISAPEEELSQIVKDWVAFRKVSHDAVLTFGAPGGAAAITALLHADPEKRGEPEIGLPPISLWVLEGLDAIEEGIAKVDENQRKLRGLLESLEKVRSGLSRDLGALPSPDSVEFKDSLRLSSSRPDDGNIVALGVNREASVKVISKVTASSEKKPVTTVSLRWEVSRWEFSTGLLVSSTPNRSFANAAQFEGGQPVANRFRVTQTKLIPAIVPVGLVHYRLRESGSPYRKAFLLTGGAGVNPGSASADFAGGVSFGWRNLVISALLHGTRELVLTEGYKVGTVLSSGTPAPPTTRNWKPGAAIGITYRIKFP
jgi:hypothetical protein